MIDFWVSIGSAYSYLAVMRRKAVGQETGTAFRWRPFGLRGFKSIVVGGALGAAPIALALMLPTPKAEATPYFARQTGRSCSFCHRGVPRLNDTGLAFKNNGFRLPESNKPSNDDQNDAPRP
jgi:hypothetical protein